jgi:Mlc titration factor MtfA (ptsG expression regulator)
VGPAVGAGVAWVLLRRSLRRRHVAVREFPAAWRRPLERYVRYYTALAPEARTRFERDMALFLDEAEITGVRTVVSDDVRVLVAASAVMLTFGRPGWEYSDLPEILVYPRAFDSDFQCTKRREILGMVVPGNAIVLSRADLVSSFRRETRLHVGLHEFAHMVDFEDGRFDGVPRGLGWEAQRRWQALLQRELVRVRRGESVLDDYAGTNEVELFAVAVESFFRDARRLRARHAALYDALREYLNQDPAGGG